MKNMLFVVDQGGYKAGEVVELNDQDALDAFVSGAAVTHHAESPVFDVEPVAPVEDKPAKLSKVEAE